MNRPTYETLLALAEECDKYWDGGGPSETMHGIRIALHRYRAAIRPPLRTRQEVDAEIAKTVRYLSTNAVNRKMTLTQAGMHPSDLTCLERLCSEPTREPEAQ